MACDFVGADFDFGEGAADVGKVCEMIVEGSEWGKRDLQTNRLTKFILLRNEHLVVLIALEEE